LSPINEGAIAPWSGGQSSEYFLRLLEALASELKFSMDNPWKKLSAKAKDAIINGFEYEVHVKYKNRYGRVRNSPQALKALFHLFIAATARLIAITAEINMRLTCAKPHVLHAKERV
jgi:excinuclease UvrABC ATPase subunit